MEQSTDITGISADDGVEDLSGIEAYEALAIFTQVALIVLVLIIGWQLEKRKVAWLSEAAVGMLVGIAAGGVTALISKKSDIHTYSHVMNFDPDFFFFALLPPIIFDAGYSLDPKYFFGNFGTICLLAFFGTFISAVIISTILWVLGLVHICFKMNFLQAGLFGSLISATDPVTTLAILGHVGADPNLYYLIFGESVLNDAVAIVMYQTLNGFQHQSFSAGSVFKALGTFLLIFVGSCFIGGGFGLICSLFFRFAGFKMQQHNIIEACLLVPIPIAAYMAAEGTGLSGIVSILFCGIVMARYTRKNLSDKTRDISLSLFKVLAKIAEAFVFIYMGLSLFLTHQSYGNWSVWTLFAFAFASMLLARLCNVYPSCFIANLRRSSHEKISKKHRFFIWFSGLRGAIAFALAMKSKTDVGAEVGEAIFSTTLLIVLVTVFVFGGFTPFLLSKLDVHSSDRYDHLNSFSDLDPSGHDDLKNVELGAFHDESSSNMKPTESQEMEDSANVTPFKKLIRTASGKVTLEEIDRQIEKVFVTPPSST